MHLDLPSLPHLASPCNRVPQRLQPPCVQPCPPVSSLSTCALQVLLDLPYPVYSLWVYLLWQVLLDLPYPVYSLWVYLLWQVLLDLPYPGRSAQERRAFAQKRAAPPARPEKKAAEGG